MRQPKATTDRTILIDADVIAFIAAAAAENTLEDEHGYIMPFVHMRQAEAIADNMVLGLKLDLNATAAILVLSDSTDNWRHGVDPTYKTNRVGPRPQALKPIKAYLREKYKADHWPGLEADDTLGIMATMPWPKGSEVVVVGRDKDFKSIPGLHYQLGDTLDGKPVVRQVTREMGDRFHLIQTLAGDHVDGYSGCPGIGMDRAAIIVDNPVRLVPREGVKTRGINKGDKVTYWDAEPTNDMWACIVSHYRKVGLAEADALITARLARILRWGEYDKETESVTLWTPSMITAAVRT